MQASWKNEYRSRWKRVFPPVVNMPPNLRFEAKTMWASMIAQASRFGYGATNTLWHC